MKELLPPSMVAQAMTSVNLFTILGAGIMTHILGMAVGCDPCDLHGPGEFESLWYVGGMAVVLVTFLYAFVPDSKALKAEDT